MFPALHVSAELWCLANTLEYRLATRSVVGPFRRADVGRIPAGNTRGVRVQNRPRLTPPSTPKSDDAHGLEITGRHLGVRVIDAAPGPCADPCRGSARSEHTASHH